MNSDRESQYEDVIELSDDVDEIDYIDDDVPETELTKVRPPQPTVRRRAKNRRRRTMSSDGWSSAENPPKDSNSAAVKRRLRALKRLYLDQKQVDFQFFR